MPDAPLPPYLSDAALQEVIARGLAEDVGAGDVTSEATVPADTWAEAQFLAKEAGIVAGLVVAERVFAAVDPSLELSWLASDGDAVTPGTVLGRVRGPARSLLTAERLALNLLQRMSGIATLTHQFVEVARAHGPARLLDTRKTAPGLRLLDKWAVLLGGGENHRVGLFDMILVKDNHIDAAGGVRAALEAARRYRAEHPGLAIEVETRSLAEVDEVLATGGADRILLDNMVRVDPAGVVDTSLLAEAVARVGGRCETEASGNVRLETVGPIAATGVDFISCGALTHSVRALDISLKIRLAPPAR